MLAVYVEEWVMYSLLACFRILIWLFYL